MRHGARRVPSPSESLRPPEQPEHRKARVAAGDAQAQARKRAHASAAEPEHSSHGKLRLWRQSRRLGSAGPITAPWLGHPSQIPGRK